MRTATTKKTTKRKAIAKKGILASAAKKKRGPGRPAGSKNVKRKTTRKLN